MKFITIATQDLKRLLELAAQQPFAVIDGVDNTDGEGVWHCDVEFYDEQGDETPEDVFSFNETSDNYRSNWDRFIEQYEAYTKEDIEGVAEEMDIVLNHDQLQAVYDRYSHTESMSVPKRDTIENAIREILDK